MSDQEKRYGIWHSGLTGRHYAAWAKRRPGTTVEQDLWEVTGVKHDVPDDIEAILRRYDAEASAAAKEQS